MQGVALTFMNVVLFSEFSIHMKLLQNMKSSCYFLMRFLCLFMTSQLEFEETIQTIFKFLYFINIFLFNCVKQLSIREIQNKPVSVVKF